MSTFKVDSTLRCFQSEVAKLERRLRHVRADLDKLFAAIAADPRRQKHADRVQGVGGLEVWKYRQSSSDLKRGSAFGWRVLVILQGDTIYPAFLYSKTDHTDLSAEVLMAEIRKALDELSAREK